jgi:predicted NAD/FAD-dependent oxidoreductase
MGQVFEAAKQNHDAHFVASPGMNALVRHWAQPLGKALHLHNQVQRMERNAKGQWTLHSINASTRAEIPETHSGFDRVLLAVPSAQAEQLVRTSGTHVNDTHFLDAIGKVEVAPCWTLMLAFPNANNPDLPHLGPQWNAARSTHHRIAWLARESSKPGRGIVERWTVQASAAWSQEHVHDDVPRAEGKLLKAFAEVTGIRAQPAHVEAHRWLYAKTEKPMGRSHVWDAKSGIGLCGDWCLGHRVENAFVSGLELALAIG